MRHTFAPLDHDAALWLSRACRIDFMHTDFRNEAQWFCVTGRDDAGGISGVCIFEFKTPWEADLSIAIQDPRCITRRVMHAMFTAVFSRATRVTAMCEPHNVRAIRQAKRMGFQKEGYMRCVIEGTRDALVLGMLREDCKWLNKVRPIFPASDPTAMSSADRKSRGNHLIGSGSSADSSNLRFSQAGPRMINALPARRPGWIISPSRHGIIDVVLRRSPIEMVSIAARWVVARMKSIRLASRGSTVREEACYSGGNDPRILSVAAWQEKQSVALAVLAALPRPALVFPTSLDLRPETAEVFRGQCKHGLQISGEKLTASTFMTCKEKVCEYAYTQRA